MYGIVWKYSTRTGEIRRLVSAPESLDGVETADVAKNEGRQILADVSPEHKKYLSPLSVVEITENMALELMNCPKVTLPAFDGDDDLEFVDVGTVGFWDNQSWWNR
jgi:hypothetical protein